MIGLTNVKRAAAAGAVSVLLLTGGAVPALAASPSETVAECTTAKKDAKIQARMVFKDAKIAAWKGYATAVENADSKGAMKAAAKDRRMAVREALTVRKDAFKDARVAFRECMATASDATPDTT